MAKMYQKSGIFLGNFGETRENTKKLGEVNLGGGNTKRQTPTLLNSIPLLTHISIEKNGFFRGNSGGILGMSKKRRETQETPGNSEFTEKLGYSSSGFRDP